MKFSFLLLVTLTLIINDDTYGQNNMQQSRIILNDNIQLIGYIDFKDWDILPRKFDFVDDDGKELELTPLNTQRIEIYGENNCIYLSKTIPVAQFDNALDNLISTPIPVTSLETIFVKSIILGHLSLFEHKDNVTHYFLAKDSLLEELIYHKYFVDNQRKKYRQSNMYKGQLLENIKDCQKLHSQIGLSKFDINHIKNIIIQYNDCSSDGYIDYVSDPNKSIVKIGLIAGLSLSHLTTRNIYSVLDYGYGVGPKLGATVSIALPSNFYRNQIQMELLYSSVKSEDMEKRFPGEFDYIDLQFIYKYHLANNGIRPFVKMGYKISTLLNNNTLMTPMLFPKAVQGFVMGAGINLNNIDIDLNYIIYDIADVRKSASFLLTSFSLTGTYYFN